MEREQQKWNFQNEPRVKQETQGGVNIVSFFVTSEASQPHPRTPITIRELSTPKILSFRSDSEANMRSQHGKQNPCNSEANMSSSQIIHKTSDYPPHHSSSQLKGNPNR